MHLLIKLSDTLTVDDVDKIISAQLPDPEEDPVLFQKVTNSMLHGQ